MRVLAIDSSGNTATVAVVTEDTTMAEYTVDFKKTHSQTLLPMIDEMMTLSGIGTDTIDAIAVSGGPGSFTGLRIGSATAKGLGLAWEKPLIHVPTVDAMAYQLYGCTDLICPIMDARRDQVYTGMYTFVEKPVESEDEGEKTYHFQVIRVQMAIPIDELIRRLNIYHRPVTFLGDGVPAFQEELSEGLEVPYAFAPSYANRQRAAAVGSLGIEYFKMGRYENPRDHKPEYLRQTQAERDRSKKGNDDQIQVRQMKPTDVDKVTELEKEVFPDPWSEAGVARTLENLQSLCLIAEKDGDPVGYLLALTVMDELEIDRIAVKESERRNGIARQMMTELTRLCIEHSVHRQTLEVRESNTAARALYQEIGFSEDSVRKGYYHDPKEDAILMSRAIEESPSE